MSRRFVSSVVIKHAVGLPVITPRRMAFVETEKHGLGMPSAIVGLVSAVLRESLVLLTDFGYAGVLARHSMRRVAQIERSVDFGRSTMMFRVCTLLAQHGFFLRDRKEMLLSRR